MILLFNMGFWKTFIKSQYEYHYCNEIANSELEIESLKKQINSLKKPAVSKITQPKKLGDTTIFELADMFKPHCKNVNFSDRSYSLTNVTEAKRFSEQTKVAARKWINEQHDCDEFSSALNGYWNDGLKQFAFGIAWSKPHAFNIMVDDKKQIWIVEPMTNKFTKIEDMKNNSKYYPLTLILI